MTTVIENGKTKTIEKPRLVGAAAKAARTPKKHKLSTTERILARKVQEENEKPKVSASSHTLPIPDLTETKEVVTVPIECNVCDGFGAHMKLGGNKEDCTACNATGYANHKEMKMAGKKVKNAKKAKSNGAPKAAVLKSGATMAVAIGRERKMLLRLSKDEYKTLEEKAEKAKTSMANYLRSQAGL